MWYSPTHRAGYLGVRGIELGVVVLPEGVCFEQHRGGGAILEIYIFPLCFTRLFSAEERNW